jgi:hypothetical protein
MVIDGVDYGDLTDFGGDSGDLTDFGGDSGGNWDYDYSDAGVGVGSESLATSPSWWQSLLSSAGIGAGNESGLLGGISGQTAGLGATGILGALAALTSKPTVTTGTTASNRAGTTTTEVGSPEWYKQLTESLGGKISGDDGTWSDLGNYMAGGSKSVADADLSKYMNPYVESVLQPQLTRMTEDFTRGENSRRANAAQIGAFGGSRDVLEGSLATERFDKAKNEATNNALSQAYTNAMTAFGGDRTAQQWGAGLTGDIYSKLKPNTTTGVTSNIGDTQTTTAVGTEPNRLAQLANMGVTIFGLANQGTTVVP